MTINPSDLGISTPGIADLQGGEAEENAEILEGILSAKLKGPKRDLAALNSAAGLTICGKAGNLSEGLALVSEAIDSGQALEVLHKWQSFA
jgi:anthranilate phosphoribosyltransferase